MRETTASPHRAFAAAGLIFGLSLAVAGWIYFKSDASMGQVAAPAAAHLAAAAERAEALLASKREHVPWSAILVAAGSVTAFLLVLAAYLSAWRRGSHQRLQDLEREWRTKTITLQQQLLESQKHQAHIQESLAEAQRQTEEAGTRTRALEAELDQRKKSERSLSQQRQVLESSKTVLELHVQERTQALQTLKHRYELILNSAGDGICGFDVNGKASFVNPAVAQLTGWSIEELLGRTEQDIFVPNGADTPAASAGGHSSEQVFHRKDGSRFPVECVRTRIEEESRPAGAVLIFKDITERKRTEETLSQKAAELARSNAELEQFAFVASHDLQEPLRKIQAFGDRLKAKCNGHLTPEALDYLERMQSASCRMRTLIDDLLAFSRVIRRSEPFVPVDLGQVARKVLTDLEVRLEKSGGLVELGELPTIEADPMQMYQLLLNLVGNALKFQSPGSRPEVKVRSRLFASLSGEQYCELTVQDNGIGFEEQYAEKIFAVFQRLHGRGEYEGTGVGLAICRRIADRHQGTIVARGKPGEGASFIVTLPVRQTGIRPPPPPGSASVPAADGATPAVAPGEQMPESAASLASSPAEPQDLPGALRPEPPADLEIVPALPEPGPLDDAECLVGAAAETAVGEAELSSTPSPTAAKARRSTRKGRMVRKGTVRRRALANP